jgi:hypothetical protein
MTRWGLLLLVTCVLAAGCGDDDNGTSPSNAPMVFTATLSPSNEVPPVGNAESSGRGTAQITVEGNQVTMYFQLTGFPDGTRVVGAHIHSAGPGVNGPIVVNTGVSAASPVTTSGTLTEFTASRVAADAAVVQAIVNNPGGFYFNVHSPLNPGGFARGQLVRIQ